ncbi:hypothetical protein SAMN04488692_12920 [Halarsenatibacter silvermanii]|uniref:Uncharacterized protein n=1 Tax=Halarsenatibacter silvermanii TaxID=321763 RepID=A0A1G9SJD7_9FIRM|nr:hypothetical protein SAMN04488692_12920 [Halarsenatibacter silvermanii]
MNILEALYMLPPAAGVLFFGEKVGMICFKTFRACKNNAAVIKYWIV